MHGSEALQFFELFGNVNKVSYNSSFNNPLCVPRNPKLSSLVKLADITGDNKGIRTAKIKISSYKEVCFACNLGEVTRKVKDLPLIISISGDQFKEKENIPEELIINDESNLYMLVLVTMFLESLDHSISIFRFSSSPWFLYDDLASRKTKIIKRPTYNRKLGFLVFINKQMGSKVPHPAEAFGTGMSSMDIDADFRKFKE